MRGEAVVGTVPGDLVDVAALLQQAKHALLSRTRAVESAHALTLYLRGKCASRADIAVSLQCATKRCGRHGHSPGIR